MKVYQWISLIAVLFMSSTISNAQTALPSKNNIEVMGQAEEEVTADELYFSISLKEYFEDEKNQKNKVKIETLETQLTKAVAKAGINAADLRVSGISGGQTVLQKKKLPASYLEAKHYELKVNTIEKLDGILALVDSRGIQYATISRVEYSKKRELEQQLKIQALKSAKEKATYMLAALGENLGGAMFVQEIENYNSYPQVYRMAKASAVAMEAADEVAVSTVDFKKIKYESKVKVIFEIKP